MKTSKLLFLVALLPLLAAGQTDEAPTPVGAMVARPSTNTPHFLLPLRHTDVEMEVYPGAIRTAVSQTFTNDTGLALEAIYLFPLPSRATLSDMTMVVGNRRIRSVVQERKQAKKTYEKAKREGKRASLVTQERANVFTTSIANLMPGDQITVEIAYFEPSEFISGKYAIMLPLVVGERYIPYELAPHPLTGTLTNAPGVDDALQITGPLMPHKMAAAVHHVSFSASTHGIPVDGIVSATHALQNTRREGSEEIWDIKMARGTVPADGDIAFDILLRAADDPCPMALTVPTDDDGVYGLLSLFPPSAEVADVEALPREVLFVVDTSGSMGGDSINQAKAGLQACLGMLHPEDAFTIIRFASDTTSLTPQPMAATPEFIDVGRQFIAGLEAGGGTEMRAALQHVLTTPGAGDQRLPIIILLTDACVGNDDDIAQYIADNLGRRRLFTVGIGSASNDSLIRRAAELGRGQARFIRSNMQVQSEVTDLFATLDAPLVTDLSLTWMDVNRGECKPVAYPSICPDLYVGRPVQVLFHLEHPFDGEVVMTGRRNGSAFETRIPVSHLVTPATEAVRKIIPRLFARRRIDDLIHGMTGKVSEADFKRLHEQVVATAIQHQLVCRYTARVAVEEEVVRNPDGSIASVKAPRSVPRGWTGFAATATHDPLLMLLGAVTLLLALVLRKRRVSNQA